MNVHVYVNGALRQDVRVRTVRASYVRPWEAELSAAVRHDCAPAVSLNDLVRIREPGTGRTLFRGNVAAYAPGGLAREGMAWRALGKRWRLESEPVRINGRGFYVWNRRGHTCSEGRGGEDSPGKDGGKWTAGEIALDILEHALGVPAGGSAVPGHHADPGCCTQTYLTEDDVTGYSADDWLALDSIVGEFSVSNTSLADALSLLLGLNGGFYGWYVDPETGRLEVADLDALPEVELEAGELGHWQDEAGTQYVLLDNRLEWSLEGVCSTVLVQGTDGTAEEKPADIEGSGEPGAGHLGELEFVAAPWRDYAAAYRPKYQGARRLTGKSIDEASAHTPPQGFISYSHLPRVYRGKPAEAKTVYEPSSGISPHLLLPCGIIGFHEDPRPLGYNQKLWAWYWAETPFAVQAGPAGDAYECYGYERTRTVYDPAFRHTTSWPRPGTPDDEAAMGVLAERLLRLCRDVRRQGTLLCDRVDFDAFHLLQRYSVRNLGPPGPTTTPAGEPTDPTRWQTLGVNAVEALYEFERDATEISVANTFWMLEDYSELKRRLEMNLFARRELSLSEQIYACQSRSASCRDTGEENEDEGGEVGADTVGTSAETEAAQEDSWHLDDTALVLTALTRMAYDEAGEQRLYAYYRKLHFNAEGRLTAVGAETRVIVDEPVPCS
jgi:hypothetical protein